MGGKQRTIKGLEILNVDSERGLLIIRGAVPGAPGGELLITTDERTAK
jgi:large subunit ribosomal protein L3